MSEQYIYAVCFKENDVVNLRKFTFDWKNGPFYSVPKSLWTAASHPMLQTEMQKISTEINNGQKRSIRIRIDKDGLKSKTAAAYLNESRQFTVNGQLLQQDEVQSKEVAGSSKPSTYKELEGKDASGRDLLKVFGKNSKLFEQNFLV